MTARYPDWPIRCCHVAHLAALYQTNQYKYEQRLKRYL